MSRATNGRNPLRALRESEGLSQGEAAKRVGVSRALWSAWELRNREMKVTQVVALSAAWRLTDGEVMDLLHWAAGQDLSQAA